MFGLVHRPKIYKIGCNIDNDNYKKYRVINKKESDLFNNVKPKDWYFVLIRFNLGQDSDVGDFFPNCTFP